MSDVLQKTFTMLTDTSKIAPLSGHIKNIYFSKPYLNCWLINSLFFQIKCNTDYSSLVSKIIKENYALPLIELCILISKKIPAEKIVFCLPQTTNGINCRFLCQIIKKNNKIYGIPSDGTSWRELHH